MPHSKDETPNTTATYQLDGKTVSAKEYAAAYLREVLGETEEEIERVLGKL